MRGGTLWKNLSIEDDLMQHVLLLLDPISLANVEMSCIDIREFMLRTDTWKKKFENDISKNYPEDSIKKCLEYTVIWVVNDSHVRYKRLCLALSNLVINIKSGYHRRTKSRMISQFTNYNSSLFRHCMKTLDTNYVFIEGLLNDIENSQVFDVSKESWKPLKVSPHHGDDGHLVTVDVALKQICLLRMFNLGTEEQYFIAQIYSLQISTFDKFVLYSETSRKAQGLNQFGMARKVKIVGEERILILSDHINGDPTNVRIDLFHIQKIDNPRKSLPRKLVISHSIKCIAEENLSKLCLLDENLLVSCSESEVRVEVWNLQNLLNDTAEKIWSRQVVTGMSFPPVRISALEWRAPIVLVGRSDGRTDVWDTKHDVMVRTLIHGLDTGLKMNILQLVIQDMMVYCLTEAGWLFAWDWDTCITDSKAEAKHCWIMKASKGRKILCFATDQTKILAVESGVGLIFNYVVKRDFLNHIENDKISKKRKLISDSMKIKVIQRSEPPPPVIVLDKEELDDEIIVIDEEAEKNEVIVLPSDQDDVIVLD